MAMFNSYVSHYQRVTQPIFPPRVFIPSLRDPRCTSGWNDEIWTSDGLRKAMGGGDLQPFGKSWENQRKIMGRSCKHMGKSGTKSWGKSLINGNLSGNIEMLAFTQLCVYRKGTPVKKGIEVYKIQPKISDNMWWDFFLHICLRVATDSILDLFSMWFFQCRTMKVCRAHNVVP